VSQENLVYLKAFGESVEIQTASPFLIRAIVEPDTETENLQTVKINHQSLLVYIPQTDLINKGVQRRQTMVVRGLNYSISEIGDDLNGMAVMRVSRT
jgi:hypothetical protein